MTGTGQVAAQSKAPARPRARLRAVLAVLIVAAGTIVAGATAAWADAGSSEGSGVGSQLGSELQGSFLPWVTAPGGVSKNWPLGLIHGLVGMAGAAVTVYLFNREFLPAMGGRVALEEMRAELTALKTQLSRTIRRWEYLAQAPKRVDEARVAAEKELTDALQIEVARVSTAIEKETTRLRRIGVPLYVILGGFFATAFALSPTQALVIGFGWTAVAEGLGLQREKNAIRDSGVSKLSSVKDAYESDLERARAERDGFGRLIQAAAAFASPERATKPAAPPEDTRSRQREPNAAPTTPAKRANKTAGQRAASARKPEDGKPI